MFAMQLQAPSFTRGVDFFSIPTAQSMHCVFQDLSKNTAAYFSFQRKAFCQLGPARTDMWQSKNQTTSCVGGEGKEEGNGSVDFSMQKEAESDISIESRSVGLEPLEVQRDAAPQRAVQTGVC